ncbi:YopX family protein [Streptococcus sp. SR1]|uniref:YopX family protein n=2 Tax=Streptococcus sp. SR1 TaxID=1161416 RepID=UPI00045083F2|nr:YopX family protein [Streptococcus sp. SR1]EUC79539.1 TIGR01671-like family protein [Streptococcus sp. SR1]
MIPKFRAWMKSLKWMCDVTNISFDSKFLDICHQGDTERCTEMSVEFDEIELMQSTGLKDLNGVEIFEGDIVQFFDSLYTVFYDIKEGCYRLKPHDDRWVVDYMCNFSSEESLEVVSNIYETKE